MTSFPDNETLQETLRQAASGDETAWRAIVEAYAHRVHALINARCRNSELAEEITQSTFCTIVVKIHDYVELGKFEPWLFRIAVNRLRDEMRRRGRQATPIEGEVLAAVVPERAPEAADPESTEALRRAIERLPDADQRILHLRHVAGLSFSQISDVLDEPLGTVLARQHRALKKLRGILEEPLEPS